MGTVFVAVAGKHGDNAENFYKMFPAESVLPNQQILKISRFVRISPPSLYGLLQAIIKRKDKEIVIVSHGSPTQLALPLMRGIKIGIDLNFINAILGPDDNAKVAQRLKTNARNVSILRSRIKSVHKLRIKRLEFRACRIGQNKPTLEALKRLFGANLACAPRVFDGYGRIRGTQPTTDAAILIQWQATHPGYQTFGAPPNRFYWVNDGSVDPPKISDVFAESWKGVQSWIEAKFPSGKNHKFKKGTFYYHIQTTTLPTSSPIHGHRTFDNNFVFPNDPGYRKNLEVKSSSARQPASHPKPGQQGRGPIGNDTRYAAFDGTSDRRILSPQQSLYRVPGPARSVT